jgi:cyanophycin synthetase
MELKHLRTYYGPNPFSDQPVLVVSFTRPLIPEWRCADLPLLVDFLRADPFGLSGKNEELDPATTVLDLTRYLLNKLGGAIKDYAVTHRNLVSAFVIGFFAPEASFAALETSVAILGGFICRPREEVDQIISRFIKRYSGYHPDYQANILIDYARKHNIPFFRFAEQTRFWQFGWGANSKIFLESLSNDDGAAAFLLQSDKVRSKSAFRALGVPTPDHVLVRDSEDLRLAAKRIGFPCVVKPADQGGGKGVTADVRSASELQEAFDAAREYTKAAVLIEQRIEGDEHRIMVMDGKFVCAVRRRPSQIVGDGTHSIRELIGYLNIGRNSDPASGELGPIKVDGALERHLQKRGYCLETVLPDGEGLSLRSVSNLSMGGVATDVTDRVNPEVRSMSEHLARTLGLGAVGFDYVTSDIGQPSSASGGAFIEMNTTPGLDICLTCGIPIERVLDRLLGEQTRRIPIRLVILKAEVDLDSIEEVQSLGYAVVSGGNLRLDSTIYRIGPAPDWSAVRSALRHRGATSVDIYTTAEEIVSKGLPVDRMSEVVLADSRLPKRWVATIQRHAEAVITSTRK